MRAIVQRVSSASVQIDNRQHAAIKQGFLILLGIHQTDTQKEVDYLVQKINGLRIFSDAAGKMNLDIHDVQGELLVVSQFTLYAKTQKGNRPSYIEAARPEIAVPLYESFIHGLAEATGKTIQTGIFGADMQVNLCNDGPVTIILDTP